MSCIATGLTDNVRGDVLPLRALPRLVAGGRTVLAPENKNLDPELFYWHIEFVRPGVKFAQGSIQHLRQQVKRN